MNNRRKNKEHIVKTFLINSFVLYRKKLKGSNQIEIY